MAVRKHQAKRRLRSPHWDGPILAAVLLILACFSGATLYLLQKVSRNEATDARVIRRGEFAQCQRVQVRRALGNANTAATRDYFLAEAAVLLEPSLVGRLSPTDRAHRRALTARLTAQAAGLRYEPATDCTAAVDHPQTYRSPLPQHFTSALADRCVRSLQTSKPGC